MAEALARNARDADAYVDKLCEENRKRRANPPLPDEPGTEHDAAAFMAPLMDYERPLDKRPGRLHLRAGLAERLRSYGPDWPVLITDADLAGLDFRWLAELRQYDHWTLLGAGRLRDLPPNNLFQESIPNDSHLMDWAKLRYALAFRRSDLPAAVGEVRHLAMLVHTQRILLASRSQSPWAASKPAPARSQPAPERTYRGPMPPLPTSSIVSAPPRSHRCTSPIQASARRRCARQQIARLHPA